MMDFKVANIVSRSVIINKQEIAQKKKRETKKKVKKGIDEINM
jgi:hypothetical protein